MVNIMDSITPVNQYKINQPIRLPGLKPGVCSGLILSGAFTPI